jgi:hypothetical protein
VTNEAVERASTAVWEEKRKKTKKGIDRPPKTMQTEANEGEG